MHAESTPNPKHPLHALHVQSMHFAFLAARRGGCSLCPKGSARTELFIGEDELSATLCIDSCRCTVCTLRHRRRFRSLSCAETCRNAKPPSPRSSPRGAGAQGRRGAGVGRECHTLRKKLIVATRHQHRVPSHPLPVRLLSPGWRCRCSGPDKTTVVHHSKRA